MLCIHNIDVTAIRNGNLLILFLNIILWPSWATFVTFYVFDSQKRNSSCLLSQYNLQSIILTFGFRSPNLNGQFTVREDDRLTLQSIMLLFCTATLCLFIYLLNEKPKYTRYISWSWPSNLMILLMIISLSRNKKTCFFRRLVRFLCLPCTPQNKPWHLVMLSFFTY